MTTWEIKAKELTNCNCAYGCPCQFNALPTKGYCEAAVTVEIEEGHYGDVKLDGLRMGGNLSVAGRGPRTPWQVPTERFKVCASAWKSSSASQRVESRL